MLLDFMRTLPASVGLRQSLLPSALSLFNFFLGPEISRPATAQDPQGLCVVGIQRIVIQRIVRYIHEPSDVSREALHQRPRILRGVQKFLFSPHKRRQGTDRASPLGLTIAEYRSTRLTQLTINFRYVALNGSDSFKSSA
jgi:hypothetical protein